MNSQKSKEDHSFTHTHKISNILDLNLPARSSVFFTLINLMAKGAAFLFTPVFTRMLSPEEYGEYSLFSSFLSVALVIGSLELSGGVILRAHQKYKSTENITSLFAYGVTTVSILFVCFIIYIWSSLTDSGMSFPFAYALLFINAVSANVINLFLSGCKYRYKWLPSLIVAVAGSLISPILSILAIEIRSISSLDHVMTKIGIATFITASLASVFLILTVKRAIGEIRSSGFSVRGLMAQFSERLGLLLRLAMPLLPYYISIMAIAQSDKLVISEALGKEMLAKYSVAYSAGIALSAVTGGIQGSLGPWIMRKVRAAEFTKIRKTLDLLISFYSSLIILFLSLCPDILPFLAPEGYGEALPVMFTIALCPIPLALAQSMSGVAIAEERVLGVLASGIPPALFSVFANILFVKRLGIFSASVITLISYIILVIAESVNTKRLIGMPLFDFRRFAARFTALGIFSFLIYFLRESRSPRILISLGVGIYILYMLKRSKPLLSESNSGINRDKCQ